MKSIGALCTTALAAALLAGCYPLMLIPEPRPGAPDLDEVLLGSVDSVIHSEWEEFGAYYEVDEVYLEADLLRTPAGSIPRSRATVNRRIRILTDKGLSHATIDLPFSGGDLAGFEVFIEDSTGTRLELNRRELRDEFLRKGTVVFPQAHPGCLIGIRVTLGMRSPLYSYEHWFRRSIPVSVSRFTLLAEENLAYHARSYGGAPHGTPRMRGPFSRRRYTMHDVMPREREEFQETIDLVEPRVAVVMRRAFTTPVADSWHTLIDGLRTNILGDAHLACPDEARAVAERLSRGIDNQVDKVDAVLHWVQDSLSIVDEGDIDIEEVIETRQGSPWGVTLTLYQMIRALGEHPDLRVTRFRSLGGLDPDFVNPKALIMPVVVIDVGGYPQVAFPFAHGAKLGEYPRDLFGMFAVSIRTSVPKELPKSPSTVSSIAYTVRIDSAGQHMDLVLDDYAAFRMRSGLYISPEKDIRESLQKMLTGMGTSNALTDYTLEGLHDRGAPIRATIEFDTPGQTVERKGRVRLSLSHLFRARYLSYDIGRTSSFSTHEAYAVSEKVVFMVPPGASLRYDIPCTTISNALFECTCTTDKSPDSLAITRVITGNPTTLAPEQMQPISEHIRLLNDIENAYVITE